MALTLDNLLVGTANGNGVNSLLLSNFSTAGTNRLVLVESDESQDASTVSTVTATGLSFSKVASVNKGANQGNVEVWGAFAAAQQTNVAITVTYTGSNFPQCAATTHCFAGIDFAAGTVAATVGATGTAAGSSTTPSGSVTTTKPNSLVIAAIGQDSGQTVTAGTAQTDDKDVASAGGVSKVSSLRQNANTGVVGSVTMNATLGGSVVWGIVVVEILAAPSGFRINPLRPAIFKPGLAR